MVSNELVAYQEGGVLKNIITEFITYAKNQPYFSTNKLNTTDLPKLIEKRLGSKPIFLSCEGTEFATVLPDIKRNATIFPDYYYDLLNEKDLKRIKETCNDLEGSLDFKNGRIGGIFSKFEIPIIIGDEAWKSDFFFNC